MGPYGELLTVGQWHSLAGAQELRDPGCSSACIYIVHNYSTDCFCSSALLIRLSTEIVTLAAFFWWPDAQFEEG